MSLTSLQKFENKKDALIVSIKRHVRQAAEMTNEDGFYHAENRLKLLERHWTKYESTLESMDKVGDSICMNSSEYQEMEELMLEAVNGLQKIIGDTKDRSYDNDVKSRNNSKLPKIELPVFSGLIEDWESFHDRFESMIVSDKSISNVDKLQYLQSSVHNEAQNLIRGIKITDKNFDIAWQLLKKRYQHKRSLINSYIVRILAQEIIKKENVHELKSLLDTTMECLNAIRGWGIDISNWDAWIVCFIGTRFDPKTYEKWESSLKGKEEVATLDELTNFLEERFRILDESEHHNVLMGIQRSLPIQSSKPKNERPHLKSAGESRRTFQTHVNVVCNTCDGPHMAYNCEKLLKMSVKDRKALVYDRKLCKNCLFKGHTVESCRSKFSCVHCKQRHHSLLHSEQTSSRSFVATERQTVASSSTSGSSTGNVVSTASNVLMSTSNCKRKALLATALVPVIANGRRHILRALIDQGSEVNLITESACQLLNISRSSVNCPIVGIGETSAGTIKHSIKFVIGSIHNDKFNLPVTALVMRNIASLTPQKVSLSEMGQRFSNLLLADPHFSKIGEIDLLLGVEAHAAIVKAGLVKDPSGAFLAQNTELGWILSGKFNDSDMSSTKRCNVVISSDDSLRDQLRKFWELEETSLSRIFTAEEKVCEEWFMNNHSRDEFGRYHVKLPFKNSSESMHLGESKKIAMARLLHQERQFERNPKLKEKYSEVINEYLELDHMELVSPLDTRSSSEYCILPHHAVIKESSSTTKVRVVFDASCKTSTQYSLNELLMVGPTIQDDLATILLRWRTFEIVFTADVEKMYRQIFVDEPDCHFQRILWRNDPNEEIRQYMLKRITFGTASAPYQAIRTVQQLAIDEKDQFPVASQITLRDCYVDDYMSGAASVPKAIEAVTQLNDMMASGGFLLRKWTSNSKQVLQHIPPEHLELQPSLELYKDETIKALGIHWCPDGDSFGFKVNLGPIKEPSKRNLLSDVAKLFDPLGWLGPSTVVAKMLLQRLWISGLNWDEKLPDDVQKIWFELREELQHLEKVKIPRWLSTSPSCKNCSIHGFADASQRAYAAVVYLRTVVEGEVKVMLVTAKTKVAPTKPVSLARLELVAAVLLARLLKKVKTILTVELNEIYAYTDSMITLAWINAHPARWEIFVANRVTEIHEIVSSDRWRHVKSAENPADCASRGLMPSQLVNHQMWFNGPEFLQKSPEEWPQIVNSTTEQGKKKTSVFKVQLSVLNNDLIERFSTLLRLFRFTALCNRWLAVKRKDEKRNGSFISTEELRTSKFTWIKIVQNWAYGCEMKQLRCKKPLPEKSKLNSLLPFIDENGILRVGGRLKNALLPFRTKHPIIIPSQGQFTWLLVNDAHHRTLHGGVQLTLQQLRNEFWIMNGRNTVRQQIHNCVKCHRYSSKTATQLMADLPMARVTQTGVFLHTGVDFCGPFECKTSIRRNAPSIKGYICVFICLNTRAIHLEMVRDMSTQGFIDAFKRFTARRGIPSDMYSDNGTNFVGASRELPKVLINSKNEQCTTIIDSLSKDGTQWHFNPPAAPHFGGIWEAAVKSTKFHLKRVIGDAHLLFDEYITLLAQIESCLNSRPICKLTSDPDDLEVLTPGHFLIGRSLSTVPEPDISDVPLNRLKRYQQIQRMYQHFWQRWSKEYLLQLQQRHKWKSAQPNFHEGMIVLVTDERLPPSKWLLGKIINAQTGKDGLTRVVEVKCESSVFKRPIHKLIPLPIIDNIEEVIEATESNDSNTTPVDNSSGARQNVQS